MNMKRQAHITFAIMIALSLVCCGRVQEEIDDLYLQVEHMKEEQQRISADIEGLQSSINSLQSIMAALQTGTYIKSILETKDGYIISLSNGENLTIRNGADGADGYSPSISVRADESGAYFWTLDGEYLLDDNGNKVRADGILPLFDIRDNYWFVSLDNGKNWRQLGKAVGEDGKDGLPGQQIFREVRYTPGSSIVVFALMDGTEVTMPCYQAIKIEFNVDDNCTGISAGETVKVDYTLSYGDENTVVTAFSDGNYIVTVQKKNNVSGSVIITCPGLYMDGHVNLMAYDGEGYAAIGMITFYEKKMTFHYGLNYRIPTEGGRLEVPLSFNFSYFVEPDANLRSWAAIERTKAETLDGTIVLDIDRNSGAERTGRLLVYADNSAGSPFAAITITQDAAYFSTDVSSIVFGSAGGSGEIAIQSSEKVNYRIVQTGNWLSASLESYESENRYILKTNAERNTGSVRRSAKVELFYANNNRETLKTIDIVQFYPGTDDDMDLKFKVSANPSNDGTVYLPIEENIWENICVIDWGDGSYDLLDKQRYDDKNGKCFHKYNLSADESRTYEVRVSGRVERLNSSWIPEGYRSGIIGVIQWGHTGLREMSNAFRDNTRLEYLPDDNTLAFADVTSFRYAFCSCPRLKTIPSGLFASASKAVDFSYVFDNCESLQSLPSGLFSNCQAGENFLNAFNGCYRLISVPENVFSGCHNATGFESTFAYCSSLGRIPEGLFAQCENASIFSYTFRDCRNLSEIPQNIFRNNKAASTFMACFYNCTSLSSIPEKLFDGCPDVTDFRETFYYCSGLVSVPTGIFDMQRKVKNFAYTFCYCRSVVGETPFTVINGKKVHLYERELYPDYFVTPSSHENCFTGNDKWNDYASIPESWRINY